MTHAWPGSQAARGARARTREGAARSDLAAKHWWLAAAVSALDDHVYFGALHPGGRYEMLFSGPNLENLLGGRPAEDEDVVAIWQSRIEPADLPAYKACELELLAGRPAMVDYRVHGLDGKTRWVRARVHPEQLADGTVRFAGILSDITEQHEADDRLRAALAELAAANERLDAAHSQALELARTDALTGAANRRHVDEALRDMLSASGPVIGLLLLDIDDFKDINDRYGHRVGDEVLIELVNRSAQRRASRGRRGPLGRRGVPAALPHRGARARARPRRAHPHDRRGDGLPDDGRRSADHRLRRRRDQPGIRAGRGCARRRGRRRAARRQARRQESHRRGAPAAAATRAPRSSTAPLAPP